MTRVRYAWQRSTARVLMIIAIAFWLWFGIGSAYVERARPLNWLMHSPVPGGTLILSLSTLVAWRWEGIGGLMCLTLGFPPLAAGILFLICWKKSR